MRNLPFKIVVAILALVLVYSMFGTERFWVLHDRPVVAHLRAVKVAPGDDLISQLDDYGIHQRREPSKFEQFMTVYKMTRGVMPQPPSFANMSEPAIGESIHEFGFFGMPFGWYTDQGKVLYVRNDWGTIFAQLNGRGMEGLIKANGGDPTKGNFFPFWAHAWGWLWVLGLALAIWLWFRLQARRRAEAGLI